MIPTLLTIKGLYSYQETQIIDFTKLIEGQLFGIFGAVGSGKSSILEAISFALYGETERLNLRDNRGYNMMNLKSNELLIDFIFKNYDDKQYRFTVKGKRNSKRFEEVKTLDRCAYVKENDAWLPLEIPSAENIIGLSYTNFRRTIIIPQGKFQEFLQLKDKERTTMLKEIFALEKYEFFVQTSFLEKKNNETIQNLNGQLLHLTQTTQEGIIEIQNHVKQLEPIVENYKIKIFDKEKELKQQEETKQLFLDLENSKQKLNVLLENQQNQDLNSQKIKNYEYCNLHFKDIFIRKKECAYNIIIHNKNLKDLKKRYQICCDSLTETEKKHLNINNQFLKIDDFKQEANDYKNLLELAVKNTETIELKARVEKGKILLASELSKKTLLEANILELKTQLKSLKSSLPNLTELSEIKIWFTQNEGFEEQINSINDEVLVVNTNLQTVEKHIEKELKNSIFTSNNLITSVQNATHIIQQLSQTLNAQKQVLQNQLAHYNLQKKLGEFSDMLHNGQPCMLCGATEHPQILKVEDVEQHSLTVNNHIKINQNNIDDLNKIEKNLIGFNANKQSNNEQLQIVTNKLSLAQNIAQAHQQKFIWPNFSVNDKALVDSQFTAANEIQNAITNSEKELENQEESLKLVVASFDKYTLAITDIENQIIAKQGEISTLQNQLIVLNAKDFTNLSEAQITQQSKKIRQQINDIITQHQQISEELNQQTQTKILLNEKLETANQNLINDEAKYKKIAQNIEVEIAKSGYQTEDEIISILADNFDTETLKKEVEIYNQQLFNAKQLNQKLVENCIGKTFDADVYQLNLANIVVFKQEFEQINTDLIKEKNALEIAIKNFEQKLILTNELEKLQNRATNINTLKQLFSGSGFVSYISQVYLQNLCAVANQRFYQLTHQQFKLEVKENNDFLVRDYLNNGKTRIAKTLSGGQTFQASLSLALALAESVQQQNKAKQNFFFLDEGFGSLDKESLQTAFETLKQLRKESRIVGIISHVEDLQQEIDTYLTIENDTFKGSQVKPSWQ